MFKWIKRILPHLTIILAFMVLVFFVIDRVNRPMAFMTSEMSKWLFFIFAVLVLPVSIMAIGAQWREDAREARRELKQRAKEQALSDKLFLHHEALEDEAQTESDFEEVSCPADAEEEDPAAETDEDCEPDVTIKEE